jgi:two-component system sensor histidine kinase DctS
MGEMASLLSHELNQPLAAIASYASGSINMLDDVQASPEPGLVRQALQRIAEQAERAGRIIKSVHDFVRRREQLHETLGADVLIEAVLPLVRLQARKSGTRIDIDIQHSAFATAVATAVAHAVLRDAATQPPRVRCDRTMIEQVLINLTRNAIQAMEVHTPLADRVLILRVRQTHERWVSFSVIDAGPGIADDVAKRLFTPFFTTREGGLGLGLSLCETLATGMGGSLTAGHNTPRGAVFKLSLPLAAPGGKQA